MSLLPMVTSSSLCYFDGSFFSARLCVGGAVALLLTAYLVTVYSIVFKGQFSCKTYATLNEIVYSFIRWWTMLPSYLYHEPRRLAVPV